MRSVPSGLQALSRDLKSGRAENGWGGRIRTSGRRFQRPLTYHLSTPHPEVPRGFSRSRRSSAWRSRQRLRAPRARCPGNGLYDRHGRLRLFPKPREPFAGSPGAFLVSKQPEYGRAAPGQARTGGAGVRQGRPEPAQFAPKRLRRQLQIVPIRPATGVRAAKVSSGGRICQRGGGKGPVNHCRREGKRRENENEPLLRPVLERLEDLAPAGAPGAAAEEEERHVGAEGGRERLEIGVRKLQIP